TWMCIPKLCSSRAIRPYSRSIRTYRASPLRSWPCHRLNGCTPAATMRRSCAAAVAATWRRSRFNSFSTASIDAQTCVPISSVVSWSSPRISALQSNASTSRARLRSSPATSSTSWYSSSTPTVNASRSPLARPIAPIQSGGTTYGRFDHYSKHGATAAATTLTGGTGTPRRGKEGPAGSAGRPGRRPQRLERRARHRSERHATPRAHLPYRRPPPHREPLYAAVPALRSPLQDPPVRIREAVRRIHAIPDGVPDERPPTSRAFEQPVAVAVPAPRRLLRAAAQMLAQQDGRLELPQCVLVQRAPARPAITHGLTQADLRRFVTRANEPLV